MNQVDTEKLKQRMDEIDYSKGEARKLLQTEDTVTTEQFLGLLEYAFYELFPNKALVMGEDYYKQFPDQKHAMREYFRNNKFRIVRDGFNKEVKQ